MYTDEIRFYISSIDPAFKAEMEQEGILEIWIDAVNNWAEGELERIKNKNLQDYLGDRDLEELKADPERTEQTMDLLSQEADMVVREELQQLIADKVFVLEKIED